MSQSQYELERQQMIKECHSLIDAIAYRPGCIKLLTLAKTHLECLPITRAIVSSVRG